MKLNELRTNYEFHDSTITHWLYREDRSILELHLTFCAWMQKNYQYGDPKIVPVTLIFQGVLDLNEASNNIQNSDILEIHCLDEQWIEFILLTEEHECIVLKFKADSVDCIKGTDLPTTLQQII